MPPSPKKGRSGGKPPKQRKSHSKEQPPKNATSSKKSSNQRKHTVRVKILGLAGITVQRNQGGKSASKKGFKKNKKGSLPSPINSNIAPPSALKAVVAFSRDQKVMGTSPPSLPLAQSPSASIVLTGRQADIARQSSSVKTEEADSCSTSFDRYIAVWGDSNSEDERSTVFETTLHRATSSNPIQKSDDDASLGHVSISNSVYAPKSFEVTIALGDETSKRAAFSVGVATLAISGDECIHDGMSKVLDLPVLSLDQAQPVVGGTAVKPWVPVIAMNPSFSEEEQTTKAEEHENHKQSETEVSDKLNSTVTHKKKKGRMRLFGKKRAKKIVEPTGIKKIMTTSEEKEAFSKVYGIDPSDAVLRVSIEVYEQGSDLEKIFESQRWNPFDIATNQSIEVNNSGCISESRSKSLLDIEEEAMVAETKEDKDFQVDKQKDAALTNTVGKHATNYEQISTDSKASKSEKKSMLNNMFGSCSPCGEKEDSLRKNIIDDNSFGFDESPQRNEKQASTSKHKKSPSKNRKFKSSSSPRGVNDLKLSLHKSFDSQTRSIGDTVSSYTNSYPSTAKNTSVMQTIREVLQCSTDQTEEEDNFQYYEDDYYEDLAPPLSIDSTFEAESIGELTDLTYEYEKRIKKVQTKDLDLKVSPKVVLAETGKALTGRVLLPAAFGGDGMCVSHGARLVLHEESKEKQKREDFERIFFRQQMKLEEVRNKRRAKAKKEKALADERETQKRATDKQVTNQDPAEEGEDYDQNQYDDSKHTRRTIEYDGPVSAVYDLSQSGYDDHNSVSNLSQSY